MLKHYNYYVIKDGPKAMGLNENQEVFWADDPRKAHLFQSHQEAENFRKKNLNDEWHRVPIIKPWVILYIEHRL